MPASSEGNARKLSAGPMIDNPGSHKLLTLTLPSCWLTEVSVFAHRIDKNSSAWPQLKGCTG
jgi:hypothetical protein